MSEAQVAVPLSGKSNSWLGYWGGILVLAVLPAALVAGVYYWPYLSGQKGLHGAERDEAFYTWQTWHAGKVLGGRWWRLAEPLGPPQFYPCDNARRPHVFEGVDILWLSALTTRLLPTPSLPERVSSWKGDCEKAFEEDNWRHDQTLFSPIRNFNLLIVAIFLVNGWAAAWFVRRQTGSLWLSALAVVLVTLNWPTGLRASTGHLHLFKHWWVLAVAVTAFWFWQKPSLGRAALLGLAYGLLVQGSWHFAYMLMVAFGMLLTILAVRGVVRRAHVGGLFVAGLVAVAVAVPVMAPYWIQKRGTQEQFGKRDLHDLLWYSSELSQYVIPFWSEPGQFYHEARQRYAPLAAVGEVWNYPGVVVLLTLAGYAIWLLRRRPNADLQRRWIDYLALLSGLLVFLSLAGGISILLFKIFPQFRCYGRAGLMAVGLCAVLVPLILHRFTRNWSRWAQGTFAAACLGLALVDGWHCRYSMEMHLPEPEEALYIPSWVPWLACQPMDVKAAVLPKETESREQLYWWFFHRHAVLNTCDVRAYAQDIVQAGGNPEKPHSPMLIDLLRKRGYSILILERKLWEKHPWIDSTDGVTLLKGDVDDGQWRIYSLQGRQTRKSGFEMGADRSIPRLQPAADSPLPPE